MIEISYGFMVALISVLWLAVRLWNCRSSGIFSWKREAQLMLVYICIVVVVRFTFCPFGKVDGMIQPLLLDPSNIFPPRLNLRPIVHLLDYPNMREAALNFVGNTAMFIPLGIVWPAVFPQLNSHRKVIAAGVGCSLCIEILQLPFFDRVSDIDDLLLNSLGFLAGYGIYLLAKRLKNRK